MSETNATLMVDRFYRAFAALDATTMIACYAVDASFDDPVFSLRGREEIGAMWSMLAAAAKESGRDAWRLEFSMAVTGVNSVSVHWEAHYRFGATGRQVHNRIDATLHCNPDGLILSHKDSFDFWRWSRQALGPVGLLLGWTPLLQNKVRAQARNNLERYRLRQSS